MMLAMTQIPELSSQDIAEALRNCRNVRELSQAEMGKRIGEFGKRPMSGQAYARFESGLPLKAHDLDAALKALGISHAELPDYLPADRALGKDLRPAQARPVPVPVYGTPRFVSGAQTLKKSTDNNIIDASAYFSGSWRAIQAPDAAMAPSVEQGQTVFFDLHSIPQRDQLCVVELHDGTLLIRNYLRQDGSHLFVEALQPERMTTNLPLKDIAGYYAVKLRTN